MEYIIPKKFRNNKKRCFYCGETKKLEHFKKRSTSGFYQKCEECRENKNKGQIKAPKFERKCTVCKSSFQATKKSNKKYCSKECFSEAYSYEYQVENGGQTLYYKLRFEIFKRDNFTCQYCGRNVKEDGIKIHCDHIKPKSKGGKWKKDNLTTSCEECNLGKRDVLLSKRLLDKM